MQTACLISMYLNAFSIIAHHRLVIYWTEGSWFRCLISHEKLSSNQFNSVRNQEIKSCGDSQISFEGVITKGDLVSRRYCLLPAPKLSLKKIIRNQEPSVSCIRIVFLLKKKREENHSTLF